jgi:hypothetical protein
MFTADWGSFMCITPTLPSRTKRTGLSADNSGVAVVVAATGAALGVGVGVAVVDVERNLLLEMRQAVRSIFKNKKPRQQRRANTNNIKSNNIQPNNENITLHTHSHQTPTNHKTSKKALSQSVLCKVDRPSKRTHKYHTVAAVTSHKRFAFWPHDMTQDIFFWLTPVPRYL